MVPPGAPSINREPMSEARSRPDLSGWIVALVLFLALAAVLTGLVPLIPCTACQGTGTYNAIDTLRGWKIDPLLHPDAFRCWNCRGAGKLTPLQWVRVRGRV
jgi:hypothetical protein